MYNSKQPGVKTVATHTNTQTGHDHKPPRDRDRVRIDERPATNTAGTRNIPPIKPLVTTNGNHGWIPYNQVTTDSGKIAKYLYSETYWG